MNGFKVCIVMVVLASAAIIIVDSNTTPRWKPHDCSVDHRPHPDPERTNWFQRLIDDEWVDEECYPSNSVFKLENCSCLFESAFNSSVNETCQDRFRGVDNAYEYEEYQPALDQWFRYNCHKLVDARYLHNNDLMLYNETTCTCEWIPGQEINAETKFSVDCTTLHWINWEKQPLEDLANNYIEVYSPESKLWPAPVQIGEHEGRQAIHLQSERILTWYMAGNEKESIYITFGVASDGVKDDEFQIILSDACMLQDAGEFVIYDASFEIKYRPSDRSFEVKHWNLTFTCSAGIKLDGWTDVRFTFIAGQAPLLSVDDEDCPLVGAPSQLSNATMTSIKMNSECYLTIGGSPLETPRDYTGYMAEFKMQSGNDCLNEDIPA